MLVQYRTLLSELLNRFVYFRFIGIIWELYLVYYKTEQINRCVEAVGSQGSPYRRSNIQI